MESNENLPAGAGEGATGDQQSANEQVKNLAADAADQAKATEKIEGTVTPAVQPNDKNTFTVSAGNVNITANLEGEAPSFGDQVTGLSRIQAVEALGRGFIIALPDWGGFWFKVRKTVYVLTKEGQLLNTPDFAQYLQQDNWNIIDGQLFSIEQSGERPALFIKAVRVHLDEIRRVVKLGHHSRENSVVNTCIQDAFMYLGRYLKQLGSKSPYRESFDPKSSFIEKHADMSTAENRPVLFTSPLEQFHVEPGHLEPTAVVKALRAELSIMLSMLEFAHRKFPVRQMHHLVGHWPIHNAADQVDKAIMYLGQELNNIRLRAEEEARIEADYQLRLDKEGQRSYEAYCGIREWKSFNGDPLPQWDSVSEDIKVGWRASIERFVYRNRDAQGTSGSVNNSPYNSPYNGRVL